MTMTKVTPLHWAAINDRPDVVDLLLDCGADPNCKGSLLVLIVNQLGVESTVDYQYRPPSSLWTNPASQVEDLEGLHCTGRLQEGQPGLRCGGITSFIQRLVFETSLWQVRLLARSEKADNVEDEAGLLPVHVAASAGQVVKIYTGAFFDWPPCSAPK